MQAHSLQDKIDVEKIFSEKLKSELRPSNIVRFYEKAMKAHKSIINLEKDTSDPNKQLEFEFFSRLYQVLMTYYVAMDYANEKKFKESYQVLGRVQEEIESTLEFQQRNGLKGPKIVSEIDKLSKLVS